MDPGIILRGAENVQKHPLLVFPTPFWVGHSLDPNFYYIICPIWNNFSQELLQGTSLPLVQPFGAFSAFGSPILPPFRVCSHIIFLASLNNLYYKTKIIDTSDCKPSKFPQANL